MTHSKKMTTTKKRILCISDLQIPFEHSRAVSNVIALAKREKFDQCLVVGDEIDFNTISKYARDTPEAYEQTLDRDRKRTQEVLWDIAVNVPKWETHITRSNHTDRLYHTLLRVPGLIGLPELQYDKFMGFDEMYIKFHKKPFEFIKKPSWVLVHGDEGALNSNPGGTAINLAKRLGSSVLCGHTHRLGLQAHSQGFNGASKTLWGFEVGNLMDKRKAAYIRAGAANWQMGIGILEVSGENVTPIPIPINPDGSFTVYGKRYV